MGGNLRTRLGHPVTRQHRPSSIPRSLTKSASKPPTSNNNSLEAIRSTEPSLHEVMQLSRHQRNMGYAFRLQPFRKTPSIPLPFENNQSAPGGIRPRYNTESANVIERQSQPPLRITPDTQPLIHSPRGNQQRVLSKHHPLRLPRATGSPEQNRSIRHHRISTFPLPSNKSLTILPESPTSYVFRIKHLFLGVYNLKFKISSKTVPQAGHQSPTQFLRVS